MGPEGLCVDTATEEPEQPKGNPAAKNPIDPLNANPLTDQLATPAIKGTLGEGTLEDSVMEAAKNP
jgi:hypothetical protein